METKTLGLLIKADGTKSEGFWINVKDDIAQYLRKNYSDVYKSKPLFDIVIFQKDVKENDGLLV